MDEMPDILILDRRVTREELAPRVEQPFGVMVKYVVDVRRELIALGGELHADAEQMLLDSGSRQADLWGANYYPGLGPDQCIEFTALINIRPSQENRGMAVGDPELREAIRRLTSRFIGEGEEL